MRHSNSRCASEEIESYKQSIVKPSAMINTRGLMAVAFCILAMGDDSREVEILSNQYFATQNMDQVGSVGSSDLTVEHPEIQDRNADQFGSLPLGPILFSYTDKLSPSFLAQFPPHLDASINAVRTQKVNVSYTNVYLMRAVNLLLLGQARGDSKAVTDGTMAIDDWLAYTAANGIFEFDSPTYYAVDLGQLYLGYRYVASPEWRGKFKRMLVQLILRN